jgi:hypothetical protein
MIESLQAIALHAITLRDHNLAPCSLTGSDFNSRIPVLMSQES